MKKVWENTRLKLIAASGMKEVRNKRGRKERNPARLPTGVDCELNILR